MYVHGVEVIYKKEGRGRLCEISIETDRGNSSTSVQALGYEGVGCWKMVRGPSGGSLRRGAQVRDRYLERGGENVHCCAHDGAMKN